MELFYRTSVLSMAIMCYEWNASIQPFFKLLYRPASANIPARTKVLRQLRTRELRWLFIEGLPIFPGLGWQRF